MPAWCDRHGPRRWPGRRWTSPYAPAPTKWRSGPRHVLAAVARLSGDLKPVEVLEVGAGAATTGAAGDGVTAGG